MTALPTPEVPEDIESAIDELLRAQRDVTFSDTTPGDAHGREARLSRTEKRELLRTAILRFASSQGGARSPVAWAWTVVDKNGDGLTLKWQESSATQVADDLNREDPAHAPHRVVPLYAAPVAGDEGAAS